MVAGAVAASSPGRPSFAAAVAALESSPVADGGGHGTLTPLHSSFAAAVAALESPPVADGCDAELPLLIPRDADPDPPLLVDTPSPAWFVDSPSPCPFFSDAVPPPVTPMMVDGSPIPQSPPLRTPTMDSPSPKMLHSPASDCASTVVVDSPSPKMLHSPASSCASTVVVPSPPHTPTLVVCGSPPPSHPALPAPPRWTAVKSNPPVYKFVSPSPPPPPLSSPACLSISYGEVELPPPHPPPPPPLSISSSPASPPRSVLAVSLSPPPIAHPPLNPLLVWPPLSGAALVAAAANRHRRIRMEGCRWGEPTPLLLAHATGAVGSVVRGLYPCRYKIGIAHDLHERFFSDNYENYADEGYVEMRGLALTTATQARVLERDCISFFGGRRSCMDPLAGCQNYYPGGEGLADSPNPCFLYFVFVSCNDHNLWHRNGRPSIT